MATISNTNRIFTDQNIVTLREGTNVEVFLKKNMTCPLRAKRVLPATNSAPTRTDNTEKQETLCWTSHFLLNIWNCFVNAVKALINCIFPQRSGSRSKEEAEAAISFMAQVDGEICIAEQAEQEERQLKPAVKIEPAEGSNIALALKSMAEQQLKEAESAISFMARVDGEICIAEQEERQLKPAVKIEPTEGSNIALALKSMAE